MRAVVVGSAHFHIKLFLDAISRTPMLDLVGISDPDPQIADKWSSSYGVQSFQDYRVMCDSLEPDLAIVLGRHVDMPQIAESLLRRGIALVLEKPGGTTVQSIENLAALARELNSFIAVPFAYRYSRLAQLIREHSGDDELVYGSFKVMSYVEAGFAPWGTPWKADSAQAGGGCTLNISSHFIDLIHYLAPNRTWRVQGASMGKALSSGDVEDYSAVLLQADDIRVTIESGYVFPIASTGESRSGLNDAHMSLCVGSRYYSCSKPNVIVVRDAQGTEQRFTAPITQGAYYGDFFQDVVERLSACRKPLAGIDDLARVTRLCKAAYDAAGFTWCMR
jgi:predicted dehydrogenase